MIYAGLIVYAVIGYAFSIMVESEFRKQKCQEPSALGVALISLLWPVMLIFGVLAVAWQKFKEK